METADENAENSEEHEGKGGNIAIGIEFVKVKTEIPEGNEADSDYSKFCDIKNECINEELEIKQETNDLSDTIGFEQIDELLEWNDKMFELNDDLVFNKNGGVIGSQPSSSTSNEDYANSVNDRGENLCG